VTGVMLTHQRTLLVNICQGKYDFTKTCPCEQTRLLLVIIKVGARAYFFVFKNKKMVDKQNFRCYISIVDK